MAFSPKGDRGLGQNCLWPLLLQHCGQRVGGIVVNDDGVAQP